MTDAERIASALSTTYVPVRIQAEHLRHAILQVKCARTGIAGISDLERTDDLLALALLEMRVMLTPLDAFIDEQES